MRQCEIVIIGGGPAGLAAAISSKKQGVEDVCIIERDYELGGILNQCIHNGFGLHVFEEELTGPEYAHRYINYVKELNIEYKLNSMVVDISKDKIVSYMSKEEGIVKIQAKSIVLAMGCRERARGSINIPGGRPAGIYSAGTAQYIVNRKGYRIGEEIVVLGSGDIGLIMARRMALEGAKVKAVVEIKSKPGGLRRNIIQCLEDYQIPLLLNHTVIDIKGSDRVESVTIAKVDEKLNPILGTEVEYKCDTLLLSCGLIPENELSKTMGIALDVDTNGPIVEEDFQTNISGVFACGNVLHVHGLVDHVSKEGEKVGSYAARYVKESGNA